MPSLIRYTGRTASPQLSHHRSTYRFATFLTAASALSLATFWLFTRRDPTLVLAYDWLPMLNLVVLAVLFVAPLRPLAVSHTGRRRTLATLRRISVGGLAEPGDGKFGDVLLADALTSYAKVIGDLYVCLCMFLVARGRSAAAFAAATARPDRACGGPVVVPLILAVPSAIRLRQCLVEYARERGAPRRDAAAGSGRQHLANALKYATAFPVIILSALMRNGGGGRGGGTLLFRTWLVAALVNSLYSFYWDVAKDWDLTLFAGARERNAPNQPFGLRPRLHVHRPVVYYLVMALDLLLRCTWSLKLSPHLDHLADYEGSIFLLEFLEIFRRWVWIFFRVETEWIRNTSTGLGDEDILLGNFQGNGSKYADEDEDED